MSKTYKKSINKGLIVLNKGERTAVITLLSTIAFLLGFSLFRPAIHLTKKERQAFHNLDSMIAAKAEFEPNTPSPTESTPIQKPPAKSTPVNKSTPASTPMKTSSPKSPSVPKNTPKTMSLNKADSTELIALPQIGEVMASRIQRYRERLGGYVSMDQLFEVKGMSQERYETIQPYLVLDTKEIQHLNVNQDDFKALLRHPYLEYEQVKAIVNHRERKGYLHNWQEVREIVGDVNPLLESYLTY